MTRLGLKHTSPFCFKSLEVPAHNIATNMLATAWGIIKISEELIIASS